MKRSAMADRDDTRDVDGENRGRDPDLLKREAEGRDGRIKIRREQQVKKELARKIAKHNRMFKVAGAWVGVLIVGFLVVAWFSPALVTWMHGLSK